MQCQPAQITKPVLTPRKNEGGTKQRGCTSQGASSAARQLVCRLSGSPAAAAARVPHQCAKTFWPVHAHTPSHTVSTASKANGHRSSSTPGAVGCRGESRQEMAGRWASAWRFGRPSTSHACVADALPLPVLATYHPPSACRATRAGHIWQLPQQLSHQALLFSNAPANQATTKDTVSQASPAIVSLTQADSDWAERVEAVGRGPAR